jgi:hypothetical protein
VANTRWLAVLPVAATVTATDTGTTGTTGTCMATIGLTGTTGIGITKQIAKVITHQSIDW